MVSCPNNIDVWCAWFHADENVDVGYVMGEMYLRWDSTLPQNETEAASKAISAKLTAATAATPSATAGPKSSGATLVASLGLVGAGVALHFLL